MRALVAPGRALADGRFGDSTWVAPAAPDSRDSVIAGPRVAGRDHDRAWETTLRAPFRAAFYPLHLLANGVEGGIGFLGPRYLEPKAPHPPATGLRFAPAVRISGLDDIGLGPALKWGGDPPAPASLKASGTWSAIGHRGANAELRIPKGQSLDLRMSLEYDDKPNETYFGIGNGSSDENKSFFRLAHTDVDAIVRIGPAPRRQLRIGGGYSNMSAGRGSHAEPLLETVFTPAQAPFAGRAAAEWWYGVAGDLARLDDERDPSRGVHGRFDVRRAFGAGTDAPTYDRWTLEGRAYVPVFAKRRVIAMRAVYAGVGPPASGAADLPFYLLAQSKDASRFPGYSSGRFRDRQLAHARVEYRWLVFHGASAVALYDVGEVQPRTGLFRIGDVHPSIGGGLRLGVSGTSTLRAEIAHSVEGLHAALVLGGDF